MPSLNKVMLMGHMTRDPELRVTPKGTAICQFGLAINRSFKTESGETKDEVTFVDCEAWNKTAETIAKYLVKGRPLFVEGRLRLDQWEDKNTKEKRSKLKIVVDHFQFIGGKDDAAPGEQTQHNPAATQERSGQSRPPQRPPAENLDEDVPF